MVRAALACVLALVDGIRVQQRSEFPQLPSKPLDETAAGGAAWWVADQEMAYYQPLSGALSQNISDYYYALGSTSGLSQEQMSHRVGGKGNVHIFYLPKGPSMLVQTSDEGTPTRGHALSEMRGLISGARLSAFPTWRVPSSYRDPLAGKLGVDRNVASRLTTSSYSTYLRDLADPNSGLGVSTRTTLDLSATRKVVAYLKGQMEAVGATTCVQTFIAGRRGQYEVNNVIGFVKGSSRGSVTLGAHFDTLPSSGTSPGAEDNGSGVAAVLSALKAFRGAGVRPKKSVYFVAFGGEEQGLFGSARFARDLTRGAIPSRCRASTSSDNAAFTLDMVGWRNPSFSRDTVLMQTKSWATNLLNHLYRANELNNNNRLKLLYSDNPFGSDHMSFLNRNIPATLVTNNDGDTNKFSCYHRSCDTISIVNVGYGVAIAKMNIGAVLRQAGVN